MYTMALIKDNKSLDFLPNYVTLKNGEQIDKAEYVDMAIRTEHTLEQMEDFLLLYIECQNFLIIMIPQ